MTAVRLLRLYPRAWRERYGEEFLALTGDAPLSFWHVVDIASGAIDARLTRTAPSEPATSTRGGTAVMNALKTRLCETESRVTTRDGLIGGAMIIGSSLAAVLISSLLDRAGHGVIGEAILLFGWQVGFLLSMPFWLTKGQPVRAQAVVVGVPLVILLVIAVVATTANG